MKSDLDEYLDMICPPKPKKEGDLSTGDSEIDKLLNVPNQPEAPAPPPRKPVREFRIGKIGAYVIAILAVLIALFIMPSLYIL